MTALYDIIRGFRTAEGEVFRVAGTESEPFAAVDPRRMRVEVAAGASLRLAVLHTSPEVSALEIVLEEDARLVLTELFVSEAFAEVTVKQAARSLCHITAVQLSSANASYTVDLDGPGAESLLGGAFLAAGQEHCVVRLRTNHNVPDCRSNSYIKGVAGGTAVGEFCGLVYVAPDAQRTDAQQQNRNILLSETARITTQPQLEIYADDVKCSHGATVGQMDSEAILYMRGRCRTPLRHRTVVRGGDGGGGCQTGKIITMFDVEKIRGEFPILGREVYGKPLVYLDSGATAQKPLAVIEMVDYLQRGLNANIHRGVHYLSEEATTLYEAARERIGAFIGAAEKEEVVFTAGATASLNTVAYAWGEKFVRAGDNILVSEMEHHSNIVPWQMLAERKGAEIRVLPFDDEGRLCTELLPSLLDDKTRIVAVTQASNTLGTRPDLRPVIDAAHAVGAIAVVDGCQGVVHGGVDVQALDCDFYAFSGHKLFGPTGIGVLYGKRALLEAMPPFLGGGDMVDTVTFAKTTYAPVPLKFEAGTANFTGAIALGEAVKFVGRFDPAEVEAHEAALLHRATERLSAVDGLRIYGTTPGKCAIVSFNVEGVHPYDMGMILDKLGIAVRTGQHCAEPTMTHFSTTGMCRASFALYNTLAEADALAGGVERAVRMLRG